MPAAKPKLEVLTSFQAVQIAPDTPLRREVIQRAEALMAPHLAVLQPALAACTLAMQRFDIYLNAVMHKPPPPETYKPRRRDPNAVTYAQGLRAVSLSNRLLDNLERMREQCFRQAREAVYLRTHKRVGPRFWPSEAEAAGIAPDPNEDGLGSGSFSAGSLAEKVPDPLVVDEPAADDPEKKGSGTISAQTAAPKLCQTPDASQTPTASQAPDEPMPDSIVEAVRHVSGEYDHLADVPLTKRYIKVARDQMLRNGLSNRQHFELTRKARNHRWTVKPYFEAMVALILRDGRNPQAA